MNGCRFIHDAKKPFQCRVCQKGFCQSRTLATHMLNHHPTVSDHGSEIRARSDSGVRDPSSKRTTQLKTAGACSQVRQNLMIGSASLFERRRMCAGIIPPASPLYSGRIPLPHTFPGVYAASSLMAGSYSLQYPAASPATVGLNDVFMSARSDFAETSSTATLDVATPLSTYFRGSVNGTSSNNR